MDNNGITGYKIMTDCNIPKASFYKAINRNGEWKVEHLLRIADYFNVSLDYLIRGEATDMTKLKAQNKKLEEEKNLLYLEVKQLHKIAEAVKEYKSIKNKQEE